MIQSIYIKNCLNYFSVMIVSLVVSFLITSLIYQNQIIKIRETEVMDQGKGLINLYQTLGNKGFNGYLKNTNLSYDVYVYNKNGLVLKTPNTLKSSGLGKKTIMDVMAGHVYRQWENGPHNMMIGLPLDRKNEKFALFIKPSLKESFRQIRNIILTSLLIVLLIGISLVLITTRFLIRPLVQITNATNELARGNFHIHLDVKSKDEFGELAQSFNYMVRELNNTEQMRKDFVANVSHELQSPLAAIKGMTIALKDEAVKPQEGKLYLEQILLESERLSSLTKQLLNLSILEANKSPFHPKHYPLDRQLRNQLVAMQSLWMEKNLEIDFDLPKLEAFADESLMSQVWTNLYSNAIKYNFNNGKISVRGFDRGNQVEILISNTGYGIPKKDIPHIFERFYRGEKAHTRTAESYGLGLAVVKRIIDLHHGSISVDSAEGKETTFRICLNK
ncbi:MAG: HAMP domain-containing sensor histidine kinase [Bacillota bacterium]|nr:HAMP domain-containing sensor histidine kinase [Bacillota bacterium]